LAAGTPPRALWGLLIAPGYLWSLVAFRLVEPLRPPVSLFGDLLWFVMEMTAFFVPLIVVDLAVQYARQARRER
jgi:hypothetical protein